LTERIIGCAIKVHRELKAGFVESIYDNALAHELTKAGLKVAQQVTYPVRYDDVLVGEHRADMVVENNAIFESDSFLDGPGGGWDSDRHSPA